MIARGKMRRVILQILQIELSRNIFEAEKNTFHKVSKVEAD